MAQKKKTNRVKKTKKTKTSPRSGGKKIKERRKGH